MQTQGSLQESDLASLLQTMQSERATGTLTLENGAESSALFFLFGHLFHASGPGGEGEEVVVQALGWRDGNYHFDPRAKLPAEETIKSSPAELISAAERSTAHEGPSLRAIDGRGSREPALATADTAEGTDAAPWGSGASTGDPETSAPSEWTSTLRPASPTDSSSWSPAQPTESEERPAVPTYTPADFTPAPAAQATPEAAAPAASATGAAAAQSPAVGGAPNPLPVGSLPIPAGTPQYEGLKSAFVDFPRLLRTLRSDRHTGYIRLQTGTACGVLLFREGELVEAEAGEDGAEHGEAAFQIFRREMDTGKGLIDVIDLESDTVTSLARLLTGPPVFTGLLGRFVHFAALLEYLQEEHFDGSVTVLDGSDTGVILLKGGNILAAYSAGAPKPQTNSESIATLAAERTARIEVRGSDQSRGPIDTEAALSRPF